MLLSNSHGSYLFEINSSDTSIKVVKRGWTHCYDDTDNLQEIRAVSIIDECRFLIYQLRTVFLKHVHMIIKGHQEH